MNISYITGNTFIFIDIPGAIFFYFPCPFVFMHIPGATFIFNISLPARSLGEPQFDNSVS